jgi:hypothetical protein
MVGPITIDDVIAEVIAIAELIETRSRAGGLLSALMPRQQTVKWRNKFFASEIVAVGPCPPADPIEVGGTPWKPSI